MASEEGWPLRGSPMVMEGGRRLGNYLNTKVINFLDTGGIKLGKGVKKLRQKNKRARLCCKTRSLKALTPISLITIVR